MRSYTKVFCYLLRRNKYFLIGCLTGILLSLLSLPILNNCHYKLTSSRSYTKWIEESNVDLNLYASLQKWYIDVQQTDYEPVIIQKTATNIKSDSEQKELFHNSDIVIRDKKLKFYRPLFHTTELKIKDKLLFCILIRKEFLMELVKDKPSDVTKTLYVRQLIGELMNAISEQFVEYHDDLLILYFYQEFIYSDDNKLINSDNLLVSFNDGQNLQTISNPHRKPNHVLMVEYLISQNKLEEYSFFFLFTENTLVYTPNLMNIVQSLTVSDFVFSSSNGLMMSDGITRLNYLKRNLFQNDSILNYGLLLSSTLLYRCDLQSNCYMQLIDNVTSSNVIYWHKSLDLKSTPISEIMNHVDDGLNEMYNSITIYPTLPKTETNNLINSVFAFERIRKLRNQTKQIENAIEKLKKETNGGLNCDWPNGVFDYQKPNTRYEITSWIYWNESHVLLPSKAEVVRPLNEPETVELKEVKEHCFKWIIQNRANLNLKLNQIKIFNLYRKFDAVRGLEYLVDANIADRIPSTVRLQILKPLNQIELITDIPYVTENMRITMVLPVRGHLEVPSAIKFLNNYANICAKNHNHQTILFISLIHTHFIYLNDSIESNLEMEIQEFKRLKKVSLYVQSKYSFNSVKILFIDIHPPDAVLSPNLPSNVSNTLYRYPSEMVYLDLIARSLSISSISEQILILHCRSNMLFSTDYLNRVRLNTIVGKQIFMPIPFVEYRMRTTISNSAFQDMLQQSDLISSIKQLIDQSKKFYFDIRKDNGYFDQTNYDMMSFYLSDYIKARKSIETEMPIVRNHQSIVKNKKLYYNALFDLNKLFLQYNKPQSKINLMRSVEPELKLLYEPTLNDCLYFESNIYAYDSCKHRQIFGLGPKQKLASIVLKDFQNKNVDRSLLKL